MPAGRSLLPLADVPDRERSDGGPELVIGRKDAVIAMPVLPRWGHEIGQPVQELKRRELDNPIGPRPRGLAAGSIVRRNVIVRGGGNAFGQRRGAITIFPGSTTIEAVRFENNQILQPIFRGIQFIGYKTQNTIFENNTIETPGEDGIFIDPQVKGSVVFRNNTARGTPKNFKGLSNKATDSFKVIEEGNTWR